MRAGKFGPTVEAVGPEGETVWIPLVTWDKYFTQVEELSPTDDGETRDESTSGDDPEDHAETNVEDLPSGGPAFGPAS